MVNNSNKKATTKTTNTKGTNMSALTNKQPEESFDDVLAQIADVQSTKKRGVQFSEEEMEVITRLAELCFSDDPRYTKRGVQDMIKSRKEAGQTGFPGIEADKSHSAINKKLDDVYAFIKANQSVAVK